MTLDIGPNLVKLLDTFLIGALFLAGYGISLWFWKK